jgi:hypothetical protein
LTEYHLNLLVNYGSAFLNGMTQEELAAMPAWLRQALADIDPTESPTHAEKEHLLKVVWDSGASISISFSKEDFLGPLHPVPKTAVLRGIAKGVPIKGFGTINWRFKDTSGMLQAIKVPGYYVPEAHVRLLSMSSLLQQYPNEFITATKTGLRLSGTVGLTQCLLGMTVCSVEAARDPNSNLPTAYAYDCSPRSRSTTKQSASRPSNRSSSKAGNKSGRGASRRAQAQDRRLLSDARRLGP